MPDLPPAPAPAADTLVRVRIDEIRPAPWQRFRTGPAGALRALALSIAEDGVLEPLLVRRAGVGREGYELLAGHRRLAAVRLLIEDRGRDVGYPPASLYGPDRSIVVPVLVRDADDVEARRITLAENAHRADVSAWERAHGLAALAAALRARGRAVDNRTVHEMTGLAESTVSEGLSIAGVLSEAALRAAGCEVDDELDATTIRRLSHHVLRGVARIPDEDARSAALRAAVDRARVQARGRHHHARVKGLVRPLRGTKAWLRRPKAVAELRPLPLATYDGAGTSLRTPEPAERVRRLAAEYERYTVGGGDVRPEVRPTAMSAEEADGALGRLLPAVAVLLGREGASVAPRLTGGGGELLWYAKPPESMSQQEAADLLLEIGRLLVRVLRQVPDEEVDWFLEWFAAQLDGLRTLRSP